MTKRKKVLICYFGFGLGLYYDEYLPQEQQDAVKIIETLANSKWCTGSIAMYGKSWAGFNGLQVIFPYFTRHLGFFFFFFFFFFFCHTFPSFLSFYFRLQLSNQKGWIVLSLFIQLLIDMKMIFIIMVDCSMQVVMFPGVCYFHEFICII